MSPIYSRFRRFDVLLPSAQLGLYIAVLRLYRVPTGTNFAFDAVEPMGRRIIFGLNAPACTAALAVIDLFGLPHADFEILTGTFLFLLWNRVGHWLDRVLMSPPDRVRRVAMSTRLLAAIAVLTVIALDATGWRIVAEREYSFQNIVSNSPEYLFTLCLWPLFLCFILARIALRSSVTVQP